MENRYHALHEDFARLCDFGGRLLGSESERAAIAWVHDKLSEIGGRVESFPLLVPIWRPVRSRVTIDDTGEEFDCQPMLRTVSTPAGGLGGALLDLGRGRPEDYAFIGNAVRGKIVMIEHEYPFSSTHVHRREKIRLAIRHGAKAVLMRNPGDSGGLLSGSSDTADGYKPIPCGYISEECATRLQMQRSGDARVRIVLEGAETDAATCIPSLLVGDPANPRIVLSAHVDGHPFGESALDNASGVAVALAATRCLAPMFLEHRAYALQTIIFTAEEWSLFGSKRYVHELSEPDRRNIRLNINLDTVAGSPNLTALTSNFPRLEPLVAQASQACDIKVDTHPTLMANSDHYSFARSGIPAFRLLAGFNEPESRVRHILSGSDTRDKVKPRELERSLRFVCSFIETAASRPDMLENLV
ncbi:M28 family peptidase [Caballeronia insecticola]|uniref:M28 family peptidase n=1 Tax=Caballeronia insecticola TaxID=758793 RepID=UPI001360B1F3|nr:M28 family peptidase [Caballeronia insecticola]